MQDDTDARCREVEKERREVAKERREVAKERREVAAGAAGGAPRAYPWVTGAAETRRSNIARRRVSGSAGAAGAASAANEVGYLSLVDETVQAAVDPTDGQKLLQAGSSAETVTFALSETVTDVPTLQAMNRAMQAKCDALTRQLHEKWKRLPEYLDFDLENQPRSCKCSALFVSVQEMYNELIGMMLKQNAETTQQFTTMHEIFYSLDVLTGKIQIRQMLAHMKDQVIDDSARKQLQTKLAKEKNTNKVQQLAFQIQQSQMEEKNARLVSRLVASKQSEAGVAALEKELIEKNQRIAELETSYSERKAAASDHEDVNLVQALTLEKLKAQARLKELEQKLKERELQWRKDENKFLRIRREQYDEIQTLSEATKHSLAMMEKSDMTQASQDQKIQRQTETITALQQCRDATLARCANMYTETSVATTVQDLIRQVELSALEDELAILAAENAFLESRHARYGECLQGLRDMSELWGDDVVRKNNAQLLELQRENAELQREKAELQREKAETDKKVSELESDLEVVGYDLDIQADANTELAKQADNQQRREDVYTALLQKLDQAHLGAIMKDTPVTSPETARALAVAVGVDIAEANKIQ